VGSIVGGLLRIGDSVSRFSVFLSTGVVLGGVWLSLGGFWILVALFVFAGVGFTLREPFFLGTAFLRGAS
jgi:hypothetical protein